MKTLVFSLLASLAAATSAHGALAELNIAEGSIETPDGRFVGRDFTIVRGFKLELLHVTSPNLEGQWVALGWDNKHRLIVPSYNSDRMARLTIPPAGSSAPVQVEMIDTTQVAAAEGVLYAFDSLYFNANRSTTMRSGMYRMRDTNGDDKYDETKILRVRQGSGDHGTHTLQLTPDGKMISMLSGNATYPTERNRSRVPEIWGEDNLIMRPDLTPPGFHRAPEAHVVNLSPDGTDVELWGVGMRNPVSFAYNKDGEMFIYDADEEPNMGFTVGYRPTDIIHLTSGADTGWRSGSKVHPKWQFDFFGVIGDVGSGSPVGSAFGTGTKFPARYQDAFFAADWSFGYLWAVFLTPQGSSYKAEAMPFISGRPFQVSGVVPNTEDGSLIVLTTGSQLYRVTYVGNESTAPTKPDTLFKAFRDTRHEIEKFHGKQDPAAVAAVWPYLSDQDRAIRYAARTALEWQPVAQWRQQALNETDPRKLVAAMASLARVTARDEYHTPPNTPDRRDKNLQAQMLQALDRVDWNTLGYQDKLDLLRAYQLTMIRLGRPDDATAQRLIAKFDPYLPTSQQELSRELAEILTYLQAPSVPAKLVALIRNAPGTPYFGIQEWINPQQRTRQPSSQGGGRGAATPVTDYTPGLGISQASLAKQDDQLFYAQLLRTSKAGWTPELRKEFMEYFTTAPASYVGSMNGLNLIRVDAISQIPPAEKAPLQAIIDTPTPTGRGRGGRGAAVAAAGGPAIQVPAGAAPPGAAGAVAAAPGGGGRGGPPGTPGLALPAVSLYLREGGGPRPFNDIELTEMVRYDETMRSQLAGYNAAYSALIDAVFTTTPNQAAIRDRANELARAEMTVALARANGFSDVYAKLKLTPDRVPAFIQAINQRGGGRIGGAAAAPAAPAVAPAAPGPRGN